MARLVVLVLSGPEDRRKVITGLKFAKMAKESGELEDVRLIISAQAVGIFKDETFKDLIEEVNASVSVKACKMNAEGAGVVKEVEASGVPLSPVGKELIDLIKEGYEVISF
jgi:hypothetical protein